VDHWSELMGEWLESLVPWGIELIVWTQSLSNDWLDAVFAFFTFLGYEEFYLFILPLVYWSIDKRTGIGLGLISLFSVWVNSVIKFLFRIPRPSDPRIRVPFPETIPSFPSGHAQNAVINWGYLAYRFRNLVFWLVAIVAIVGIGLSRVFLGVHFPQDVIGGWLIGLVLLVLYIWAEPPVGRWLGRQKMVVQSALAIAVPLALIFLHPTDTQGRYPAEAAITSMSALLGLGVGVVMERAWVRFRVEGTWWRRIVRYLMGLLLVILFYVGPELLTPEQLPYRLEAGLRFARYALLGWVVAFLGPWLFVRLRLAEQARR
jgi:undecaprenyl-diphosphatase